MSKRRIGDGMAAFQASDVGLRRFKPRRRSILEPQRHVQCEFCGRQYIGFRGHWRCPWCGVRNAPPDGRTLNMTVAEYNEQRRFTTEEWALRNEREDRIAGE